MSTRLVRMRRQSTLFSPTYLPAFLAKPSEPATRQPPALSVRKAPRAPEGRDAARRPATHQLWHRRAEASDPGADPRRGGRFVERPVGVSGDDRLGSAAPGDRAVGHEALRAAVHRSG